MEGRRLAIVQTRREGEIRKERKIRGGRYGFGRLNEGWMKNARSSRKDPLFIFFFWQIRRRQRRNKYSCWIGDNEE